MTEPYATVLVPTHDRHATLAHALASGQAQTVEDIEILVVCDGATPEVLDVARRTSHDDARVEVLEFPKSQNHGGEARARALRQAASDRIFILQDDDLWFPDHIERLGAALDGNDVVTGGTLAVRLSGAVTSWASNYASPAFRTVARDTGYKLVFEADIAFSLRSYRRLDVGWERVEGRGNIRRLLERHLAESDIRWASISRPTSLSFNSPVRGHLSQRAWADELRAWRVRIESGLRPPDVVDGAHWGAALWSGMTALAPDPTDCLETYMARLGIALCREPVLERELDIALRDAERGHLEDCFAFVTGRPAEVRNWNEVVLDLMEPFAGPEPRCWAVAVLLDEAHGGGAACDFARNLLGSVDPGRRVLARGLVAALELRAGELGAAREQADVSGLESPHYRDYFDKISDRISERSAAPAGPMFPGAHDQQRQVSPDDPNSERPGPPDG